MLITKTLNITFLYQMRPRLVELICEGKISKTKVSQKRKKQKSLGYYVVISYLFAKVFEFLDNRQFTIKIFELGKTKIK